MHKFCLLPVCAFLAAGLLAQGPSSVISSSSSEKVAAIRALLGKDDVAQARQMAEAALAGDPSNSDLLAAAGDVYYRSADMAKALASYETAQKINPASPRALYGLSLMHNANSNFATARNLLRKAHELAPFDPQIQAAWIQGLPFSDRAGYYSTLAPVNAQPHPLLTLYKLMNGGHRMELVDVPEKKTLALQPLMYDANHQRGVGLLVSINGSKPLTLMLDTGASGVVIKRTALKHVELTKIFDNTVSGIGDRGDRNGYLGFAETMTVGGVRFRNCPVEIIDRNDATTDDGLIGADVFSQFLITIDFANQQMKLDPLPNAARSGDEAKLTDRSIPEGMEKAVKVYRSGNHLLVPAKVGGVGPRYFLLDTGAEENSLSLSMSKDLKGVAPDELRRVTGIDGKVERVYKIGEVVVEFGGFRQKTRGMTTFNMDTVSRNVGFETGGIIGFGLLRDFELRIDYRDGLVDFKYVAKPRSLFATPALNG